MDIFLLVEICFSEILSPTRYPNTLAIGYPKHFYLSYTRTHWQLGTQNTSTYPIPEHIGNWVPKTLLPILYPNTLAIGYPKHFYLSYTRTHWPLGTQNTSTYPIPEHIGNWVPKTLLPILYPNTLAIGYPKTKFVNRIKIRIYEYE